MTKTLSISDALYTYGDYVVVVNEEGAAYDIVNMQTGIVEVGGVGVLVQARSFAADIDRQQKGMDDKEAEANKPQGKSNITLLN